VRTVVDGHRKTFEPWGASSSRRSGLRRPRSRSASCAPEYGERTASVSASTRTCSRTH
jgi:hypothetical protein